MDKKTLILEVEQSMDTCLTLQYGNTTIIDAEGSHPDEPQCVIVMEDNMDNNDKYIVASLTANQIPKLIEQLNLMKQQLMD